VTLQTPLPHQALDSFPRCVAVLRRPAGARAPDGRGPRADARSRAEAGPSDPEAGPSDPDEKLAAGHFFITGNSDATCKVWAVDARARGTDAARLEARIAVGDRNDGEVCGARARGARRSNRGQTAVKPRSNRGLIRARSQVVSVIGVDQPCADGQERQALLVCTQARSPRGAGCIGFDV